MHKPRDSQTSTPQNRYHLSLPRSHLTPAPVHWWTSNTRKRQCKRSYLPPSHWNDPTKSWKIWHVGGNRCTGDLLKILVQSCAIDGTRKCLTTAAGFVLTEQILCDIQVAREQIAYSYMYTIGVRRISVHFVEIALPSLLFKGWRLYFSDWKLKQHWAYSPVFSRDVMTPNRPKRFQRKEEKWKWKVYLWCILGAYFAFRTFIYFRNSIIQNCFYMEVFDINGTSPRWLELNPPEGIICLGQK